jgi:molybdate transport system ATP-binding protein
MPDTGEAALRVDGSVRQDEFRLEVAASVAGGEVVAIVGPNGAGKSTLLRAVAGLVRLTTGAIQWDGAVWDEPSAHRWTPPWQRPVGWVPQGAPLWPDRLVVANVAFGAGRGRGARRRAREWLERLGAGHLGARRPLTLSGGERQRVALARALAAEPGVLLLDEPLSAVDVPARADLQRTLRSVLDEFCGPALVVTHDAVEAATLARRIIVLEDGAVTHDAPPSALAGSPRTRYVADLVGVNLLHGTASGDAVELAGGAHLTVADAGRGPVIVVIHPRAVAIHRQRPAGSPRNVVAATVTEVIPEPFGHRVRVALGGPLPLVAELTPGAVADLELEPGVDVWVAVKATEITVQPA